MPAFLVRFRNGTTTEVEADKVPHHGIGSYGGSLRKPGGRGFAYEFRRGEQVVAVFDEDEVTGWELKTDASPARAQS